MSSNMLRPESTSSSLSLCSHSEFLMVAGKNDSDSSCSVTKGEISSIRSIDCSPEDPALIVSYIIATF